MLWPIIRNGLPIIREIKISSQVVFVLWNSGLGKWRFPEHLGFKTLSFWRFQPENWNYFRSNLLLKLYTNLTPYSKKSIMKKSILKSRHSNCQLFFFLINSQGKPLVGIAVSVSKTATWSNGFSWKLNLIIVQSFFFFFHM